MKPTSIDVKVTENQVQISESNATISIIDNKHCTEVTIQQPVINVVGITTGPQGRPGEINSLTSATSSYIIASQTSSFIQVSQTASMSVLSSSFATTSSYALTASYVANIPSIDTSSLVTTTSFNTFTSSIQGQVNSLTSATSSYVLNSQTASFVLTSSFISFNNIQRIAFLRI